MKTSAASASGSAGCRYDLAVCYRIYPRVSAQPIFRFKEKLALVRLNLETFKEAIGDLRVKMWVLLDNCPPAYEALVRTLFPETDLEFLALKGEGNEVTFGRQIDLLAAQEAAELVYFAEDDYLYLPGALERGVDFMRRHPDADALNLADHAAYHQRYVDRIRSKEFQEDGRRWRTVVATALTFMMRRQSLVESASVLRTYSRRNSDLGIWMALTKHRVFNPWCFLRGFGDGLFIPGSIALAWRHAWRQILFGRRRTLWVPSPSLATHMQSTDLAPGFDWEAMFAERAQACAGK